jgi:CDP-diacylglycerol--serine O-phosphatidyltransferase
MKERSGRRVSPRLRRGVYLLPSLFTLGNIFLGFFAVVRGLAGQFHDAALAIFIAGFLDALDGRLARLTRTESDFGREFDSLADVLTFGSAPALLAYLWGLDQFHRLGWLVPLFYLACCATRLARFNVQTRIVDSRWFVGLPAPAAAGAAASVIFFAPEREWKTWLAGFLLVAMVTLGFLMVSTFRYSSFKRIDLRSRWSYRIALPLAGLLAVVVFNPRAFFVTAAVLYTLSGPVGWLWGRVHRPAASNPGEADEPVTDP